MEINKDYNLKESLLNKVDDFNKYPENKTKSMGKYNEEEVTEIIDKKFTYNKNGLLLKTVFISPSHIFPQDSNVIKCSEYTIIISPYYKSVKFYENYTNIVSPSIELSRITYNYNSETIKTIDVDNSHLDVIENINEDNKNEIVKN